ncbi:hypothetical protein [Actinoallomurus vinaceus]
MGASGVEDGSYGSFTAFDVDEFKGVVEGERTVVPWPRPCSRARP